MQKYGRPLQGALPAGMQHLRDRIFSFCLAWDDSNFCAQSTVWPVDSRQFFCRAVKTFASTGGGGIDYVHYQGNVISRHTTNQMSLLNNMLGTLKCKNKIQSYKMLDAFTYNSINWTWYLNIINDCIQDKLPQQTTYKFGKCKDNPQKNLNILCIIYKRTFICSQKFLIKFNPNHYHYCCCWNHPQPPTVPVLC